MKTRVCFSSIAIIGLFLSFQRAHAQGTTAFTYQGQLRDGGSNANGTYTIISKLYDAVTNGNQVGVAVTNSPTLANGLFTVNLDFGNVFNGSARWLDITVTNGGATQTLSPRVHLLPTPYATYASIAGGLNSNLVITADTVTASNIVLQGDSTLWAFFTDSDGNISLGYGAPPSGDSKSSKFIPPWLISIGWQFVKSLGQSFGFNLLTDAVFRRTVDVKGAFTAATVESAGKILGRNDAEIQGALTADSNLIVNGEVRLGPNSRIVFPDGSVQTNAPPNLGDWTISAGSFGPDPDALIFSRGGSSVMELSSNEGGSASVNGNLEASHLGISRGISVGDNASVLISANGNINADGDISAHGDICGTTFCGSSDKNLKEKFAPIDSREVLNRVASLPISSWNFKTDAATRHIGPTSQDFYTTFKVGADDKHIATVDEGGVALAAIQGLNQIVEGKAAKIQEQALEISELRARLEKLEQLIKAKNGDGQ